MGKFTKFAVVFNNSHGIYFPGQVLQAQLIMELCGEEKAREVRVRFCGGSHVAWSERHGSSRSRRTVYYRSNEVYFNQIIPILKPAPGTNELILSPGNYNYPLQCQLPLVLPSSFESAFGKIRYFVEVVVDRPWRFDRKLTAAFTVISPLDLNLEPMAMKSESAQGQKTLCCWCCESGPISASLYLDRLGYVPGESIPIKSNILNGSNKIIKGSRAELVMSVLYITARKSRTMHYVVGMVTHGAIPPGGEDMWNGDLLPVAPLPPSKLIGCNNIVINYCVRMVVETPTLSTNLLVPIGILIGSIPHHQVLQQYSGMNVYQPQDSWNRPSGLYDQQQPTNTPQLAFPDSITLPPNMPPPSYQQFSKTAAQDNTAFQDSEEHPDPQTQEAEGMTGTFSPSYTYYPFSNASAPHPTV